MRGSNDAALKKLFNTSSVCRFLLVVFLIGCGADSESTPKGLSKPKYYATFILLQFGEMEDRAQERSEFNYFYFDSRDSIELDRGKIDTIRIFRSRVSAYCRLIDSLKSYMISTGEGIPVSQADTIRYTLLHCLNDPCALTDAMRDSVRAQTELLESYGKQVSARNEAGSDFIRLTPPDIYDMEEQKVVSWAWMAMAGRTVEQALYTLTSLTVVARQYEAEVTTTARIKMMQEL